MTTNDPAPAVPVGVQPEATDEARAEKLFDGFGAAAFPGVGVQAAERAEHVIEVPTPNGVLCSCGKWFFSAGFTAHVVAALREDLAREVEARASLAGTDDQTDSGRRVYLILMDVARNLRGRS